MTRTVLLFIFANVMLTSLAQIVLKAGMSTDSILASLAGQDRWSAALVTATNPLVVLGLAMYVGGAAGWLVVLSRVEVSLAYPFVGLGFIITMVLGWQIYGDSMSTARVLGTLFIASGVAMLARS